MQDPGRAEMVRILVPGCFLWKKKAPNKCVHGQNKQNCYTKPYYKNKTPVKKGVYILIYSIPMGFMYGVWILTFATTSQINRVIYQ